MQTNATKVSDMVYILCTLYIIYVCSVNFLYSGYL